MLGSHDEILFGAFDVRRDTGFTINMHSLRLDSQTSPDSNIQVESLKGRWTSVEVNSVQLFLVDVYKAETMRRFLVEWRLSQEAFQIQIGLKFNE